jgi:hypothetical protein
MNLSVIPIYLLDVLWLEPGLPLYVIALVGSIFQLIAFVLLLKGKRLLNLFRQKWMRFILQITLIVYVLKLVFQVLSVLPWVQNFLAETAAYSIIGFIHLVMLGFFTLLFLAIFIDNKMLHFSSTVKIGLSVLITGIFLSEILLFSQSITLFFHLFTIPVFYNTLFWASALMPVGIGIIVWGYLNE